MAMAWMTVDQLADADLCHAPPYSAAADDIITAANVAGNKLDGHMVGATPMEVHRMLEEERDFVFLDVRSPEECNTMPMRRSTSIPLEDLRDRLNELPKGKQIVTFSTTSRRGYEAALILKAAGFREVRVMDGGVAMWPYEELE